MRRLISVLLENESGALSRVVGLFSQRGYNIETLTVAPTDDPTLSRMTIVTMGDDRIIEHRITSYNVCYTKLLRDAAAALHAQIVELVLFRLFLDLAEEQQRLQVVVEYLALAVGQFEEAFVDLLQIVAAFRVAQQREAVRNNFV